MRDNNVLAQYTTKLGGSQAPSEPEADPGQEENLGVFGWLRGIRDRAVMLELRRKDGSVAALGYSWLERIDFDPSDGITLKFAGQTVKIVGRNLDAELQPQVRLLAGLVRHRVLWIQEASWTDRLDDRRVGPTIDAIELI